MTIEEISKAKREAEERILAELHKLAAATGMDVHAVDVRLVTCMPVGLPERNWATEARIDLRLP